VVDSSYVVNETTLRERLIGFVQFLKTKRYSCSTDTILDVAKVAFAGGLSSSHHFKQAIKPCVCQTPSQWHRFDSLFDLYWRPLDAVGDENGDSTAIKKQRRRHTRASTKSGLVDMRRSIRGALEFEGSVANLAYKQPVKRLPSMVLLLDVSQSMEIYSTLFLRFTRQLMTEFDQAYAFAFNTQLFEIGKGHKQLKEADFERVMNNHGKGWLGGTQIAGSIEQFNEDYLQRLVSSKCTVIIFSDGHDTAKPELLIPQMKTLNRRAKKVIWVNPLIGRRPEGAPDPKMAHVMPYITAYCSGHNLQALKILQQHLMR